jgi:hypothetical protein
MKEKSNCCSTEVIAIGSPEGTGYYQCEKCKKPCDLETKQGESTPEEIIEANTFFAVQVNSGLKIVRYDMALKALEMARKSEREKVISIIKEKMKALDKTAGVFPGTTFNVYINQAEVVEILTNLKKEKGE